MRFLIRSLILSAMVLVSGCVIVPADYPAIGFYGPFPAVFVPHDHYPGGHDYDARSNGRGRYDDERRYDRDYRR